MRVGVGCGPPVHPSSTSTAHADRNGARLTPLPPETGQRRLPPETGQRRCLPLRPPGDREASRSVTGPAGHQPAEETPSVPLLNLRLTARGAPPQHRVGGRRLVALAGAPSQRYHSPRQPLGRHPAPHHDGPSRRRKSPAIRHLDGRLACRLRNALASESGLRLLGWRRLRSSGFRRGDGRRSARCHGSGRRRADRQPHGHRSTPDEQERRSRSHEGCTVHDPTMTYAAALRSRGVILPPSGVGGDESACKPDSVPKRAVIIHL